MRDVFIDASTSSGSDLKMLPSGKNEAPMIVGMAKPSKSPTFDLGEDIEECEEQVRDNLIAIQASKGGPTNKWCSSSPPPQDNCTNRMQSSSSVDEKGQLLEEQKYLTMVRRVFGEWWSNLILYQHVGERENKTYVDDNLKLCETMSFGNMVFRNNKQQL